ncbi:conserved hypothetical protein [Granulicella pectinivorans]|jgi:uncharacterized protein (TIGR02246 family)|uniref:DUF4440 domain-containing protein n=1 Tax=Granulicella pectinivorans TaxID=474950 RepID=A0A1I6N109_9BACT|nr:SgcJ/EcaC family oxidoreductase [Granulicella pectinivorans]SFS21633.1 conserved hypothetical protein [Granulicella pectinivorans]
MSADEKAIREVVAQWARATSEGDIVTIMNLMTEDVVFLTPGNPPMMREAFRTGFENMIRNVTVKAKPDAKSLNITVEGDVAITWGGLEIEIKPKTGGPARIAKGHTLSGFRRGVDGQWRIFRDANLLSAFKG